MLHEPLRAVGRLVEAIGVIEVSRTVELHHNIGPTSMGVNTFSTIVLLTLITNCDGGAF